ncbi:junctional protein associated with coronary artery disease [Orycteropus afer afer]|uniref:Junctional protein associated with coronary artery disease n=1 Tax=Orycteropus afer afer TaxID=1230840 RepID=A0A8B7A3B1_ORYAF|nr:junctional protein associated with coronary artery disease [Orycteropus afer afer]
MYSVEDLLISHGYKLSRKLSGPREDNYEGHQPEMTRTRAGHGMLNGYENDPAAFVQSKKLLGKGCVSDSENRRGTPRSHGEPQSSAFRTSEVGFYNQPPLVWSSQLQTVKDQAYQRRRGQEYSGLLVSRDREDLEVRGLAQAHSRPVHLREGPWDIGARTENVTKKAILEEELRMSGAAKWQNVNQESWNQPRKLGRQMSDGGGEKTFQDLYPLIAGEHILNPQNKGKSQSLPKVLSPESLSCMEMPISLNDGHLPQIPKMPLYPPNCAPNLESTRNTEKSGFVVPLPQPKFGRPLKPPSYELHQQSRGGVENTEYQDSQPTDDLYVPYLTKTSDPRQEHCGSDSSLEPPVYVPPPSYHSPSPHITNPYLEDSTPRYVCGGRSQQQPPTEKTSASCQRSAGSLGTGNEYNASPHSPHGLPQHPCSATTHNSSVQYIPFDDPRIRHIKLTHPQGFSDETQLYDKLYSTGPAAPQEPAHRKMQPGGAFLNAHSMTPMAGNEQAPATSDPSPQWLLSRVPRDGEPSDIVDQRDNCAVRGQRPDVKGAQRGHSEGHASSLNPQAESTCETITKLKKFETGLQTKKSSKTKKNETVFCLVSIPVKSESHLPEIDRNNNDLKQSADKKNGLDKSPGLQEQSLLSMSSTDLELQALTGSIGSRAELQKQNLRETEDKQTNDLRFIHPARHRELKYSGSCPGHQFRDQQTQTSFTEESKISQLLPNGKPGGSGDSVLTPDHSDPTASGAPMHTTLAPSDQKQGANAHYLKGQMYLSPSSNSAFSRTSSGMSQAPAPKACQSQSHKDVHGHRANPPAKDEVAKGEPTSPCNSQQLFGQFLLKPVSRRPWDLISQLENFNKELQEQKESSHSSSEGSSEGSEADGQQDNYTDSRWNNSGFNGYSQAVRSEQQPRILVPEDPGFRSERVKSKSESWNEEQKAGPPALGILQAEDSRGELFRSADGNWITEKRNQEVGTRRSKPAVSPGPMKRMMAFRLSDTEPAPELYPAEPRKPQERQAFANDISSVEPSRMVTPEAESEEERETAFPLNLSNKNRGLSAPDLRSVGLHTGQEKRANQLDGSFEKASAIEIPPNESLQERAERILGIEVAVESLLRASRRAGHNQHPESNESAFRMDSPREEPLTSSAQPDGPTASKDAFYGRRKCGWTESPLFVGERDMTRWTPHVSAHSGTDGAITCDASSPEPQPNSLDPKSLDQKNSETKPPFRSTLFHFIERSPSVAGSEKRYRSTSKVIECLQEKLASPLRRADPDRLMRMREVDSVSRMRLLSSRSTDSMEEPEELKMERGQGEQPRAFVSLNGRDLPRRVASIPTGIISLEENRHLAAQSARKKSDQDFWCPDSYDPSRVERV